jgi:hypothetical protein
MGRLIVTHSIPGLVLLLAIVSVLFYAVGRSEDRDRAREQQRY